MRHASDLGLTSRGSKVGSVVRTGPSAADVALLDRLQSEGHPTSPAQLERWRNAGVLPANTRTYLGRGKGSVSSFTDEAFEIAAAMSMVARRGRSLNETVLRIFTVDPRHCDLFEPSLPIGEKAIRKALRWFVRVGDKSLDRRIERAISRSRRSRDEAVDEVLRIAKRHFNSLRLHPGPSAELQSDHWNITDRREVEDLAAITVARFFEREELGSDRLAEVIINSFKREARTRSTDEILELQDRLKSTLRQRELAGQVLSEVPTRVCIDETLMRLSKVDVDCVRETRNRLAFVAEMGNLSWRGGAIASTDATSKRMLDSATESLETNMLFHAIIPIASTLTGSAWHRMTALIIMALVEPAEDYSEPLARLALAAAPQHFSL